MKKCVVCVKKLEKDNYCVTCSKEYSSKYSYIDSRRRKSLLF